MACREIAIFLALCTALGCTNVLVSPRDGAPPLRDAASPDAASPDAAVPQPDAPGPLLYPMDRRHSPITDELAMRMREHAAQNAALQDDVFAKIGDSITETPAFLSCFAGSNVDLAGREELRETLSLFLSGDAAGSDPYRRVSEAATIGWSASAVLAGDPSPLRVELDAIAPRFGIVMFGTNDVGFRSEEAFARDMLDIVDILLARGTIPLLSSIPPRDDSAEADARVPLFNLAVRAIAAGRGVPFVDYHRELVALSDHGLAGDGVHPSTSLDGACMLSESGLADGMNVRNLITLEQLDRARRALAGTSLDADAPRVHGEGTSAEPFEIASLPFAVLGDTRRRDQRALALYSGCAATQNESGPEELYRFVLDAAARVTITVVSARNADIDVHLLDASALESGCIARADRSITADLAPGTYFVAADTFVSEGELAGEYLLLVQR